MVFANPRHFGRRQNPETDPGCPLEKSEVAWALFQHKAAFALLFELRHRKKTLNWFAKRLGEDTDWLQRKLRGHAPADLGEILNWALLLGVQLLPPIDDVEDLRVKPRAGSSRVKGIVGSQASSVGSDTVKR